MARAFDLLVSSQTPPAGRLQAEALRDALHAAGHDVREFVDDVPPGTPERVTVAVSPHLVYGIEPPRRSDLARLVCVSSGGPWSGELAADMPYLRASRGALVQSGLTATKLRGLGIRAERLAPTAFGRPDRAPAGSERAVDVLYVGTYTAERSRLLAGCADVLARRRADLRLTTRGVAYLPDPDSLRSLLTRAKLLVWLPGEGDRTLDWTALAASAAGCVVVAVDPLDLAPLEANVHVVATTADGLPLAIDRALRDPEGIERMRTACAELWDSTVRPDWVATAVDRLLAGAPTSRPVGVSPPPAPRSDQAAAAPAAAEQAAVSGALLRLTLSQVATRRAVERLGLAAAGAHDSPTVEATGAAAEGDPGVSVIVPVYNYGRYVDRALDSVRRSEGVAAEVVVVDDASTDGSAEAVRRYMREHDDTPITLVALAANTGVAHARNVGVEHARADLLFMLDADNELLPRGLARLCAALADDASAAFAWGLSQHHRDGRALALSNTEDWDVRYFARGNYIDAAAMLRRDALQRAGGYSDDPALEVWEDYDLWLRLAEAGMHGVRVREIVARYRMHDVSASATSRPLTDALTAAMRQRHAALFTELEPT